MHFATFSISKIMFILWNRRLLLAACLVLPNSWAMEKDSSSERQGFLVSLFTPCQTVPRRGV